ncbi:lytic murein transglycosylase B [Neoasaia chiangmaiensis NBRC 101099]|uniref:Lytic transglycosylase n=1 Tax=Neoasaia chiangmaiensis TaxID=320497 RepID=A0A1U9KMM2_9PROT|nr:lytic transglycosylase [Neoasaia chiangmaiensis]GBR37898.1 lytic murein transglycosylase B [Neoasaia chiangmaiensis NBRC 101099]GEN15175.1 lytic transglycosylase [Neoasaia chiangmaiensis]
MLKRRHLIASLPAIGLMTGRAHAAQDYRGFLESVRSEAIRNGIASGVVDRALALTRQPNAHVLQLDRHQPEFTLTWAQYRARVIGTTRISQGRAAFTARAAQLNGIGAQYGVDPRVIVGIWGLESGFGRKIGTFSVIDSLATLAFDGRRAAFFRSELLKSLQILNAGDISPEGMLGSYAGAMGQPQFMPSAYLRYAADGNGDGRRDIWTNEQDVFASIANYLARCGWQADQPWGQPVTLTRDIPQTMTGRGQQKTLGEWATLGVRRADGRAFSRPTVEGALLRPDGPGTEAFIVYRNFNVIRRYNPSDYYALGVGLLGYAVA